MIHALRALNKSFLIHKYKKLYEFFITNLGVCMAKLNKTTKS